MRTINWFQLFIITTMLNISFTSCTPPAKQLKIKWQLNVGAPELYPSEVAYGCFKCGDQYSPLPTEIYNHNGWGLEGHTMGGGNFVPDTLAIIWYSHVEDKFFRGEFTLPADTIRALFEEGLVLEDGEFKTYDMFTINTYPEGGVALWMSYSCLRKIEIGHYKAEEIEYPWKDLFKYTNLTREEYLKDTFESNPKLAENLTKNGLSPGLFQSYRQRYPWRVELASKENRNTTFVVIDYYNGEKETIWGKWFDDNYFKQKAVPKYIMLKWIESDKGRWGAQINFDEQETFEAYRQMYKNNPNMPTKLVLVPDYDSETMKVYLRSDSLEYELRKTHNGLYPRTMD